MERLFLIYLFIAALIFQSQAQHTFRSLEEATQFALKNRPDFLNEELALQVANQQIRLSAAGLYPQVKAVGSLDDYLALPVQLIPAEFIGGKPGQMAEVQFGTQYMLSMGLEAALPLVNTQAWQNRKIAQAEAQFTKFKSQDTYLRASENIARAYYLCLLGKEALALSQENVRLNDTLLLTATHRFAAGLIEPLELNRLKALHLESQQQLSDNQTTYQNNLSRLKALVGLPTQEELTLTQSLDATVEFAATPPPVQVEQLGLYQALQWRMQAAEEERQKHRLRWVPEISAYGRFTNQAQRNTFNFLESSEPWYQVG